MFKLPLIKTPDDKAKSLCDPNFNIFHLLFIYLSSNYLSSIFHLFSTKKSSHVVTFKAAFFRGNGVVKPPEAVQSPAKLTKIDQLNHGMHGMFMDVLISCMLDDIHGMFNNNI